MVSENDVCRSKESSALTFFHFTNDAMDHIMGRWWSISKKTRNVRNEMFDKNVCLK